MRWPALFPPPPSLFAGLAALAAAFVLPRWAASPALLAAGMIAVGASWSLAYIGTLRLLHVKGPVSRAALALHDLRLLGAAAAGALAF